ncbi:SDR family oxidoreductase [Leucobacter rhizosphaerae]|uniref:SDR family oxidoreductase n=1 Tax=Leucobacter rhizosphaerae TaxID=2932245 RepID=A0ABY4FYW8_9MICO|nr:MULTISPECIES: SDR family oxidoreductase [Leucobacter]UOQ61492.1 SDR family oxidoreductase [Leucobacter rhizosphaerae]UOR02404.1 SDR family oxidoreductase [Leucobacter allii]
MTRQTVLVTGAAGGIGAAVARRLAESGTRVILTDLQAPELDRVLGDHAANGESFALDVTNSAAVDALMLDCDQRNGGVTGLVLSHGIGGKIAPLTEWNDAEVAAVLTVNLVGCTTVMRAVLRHMTARDTPGRIVAIASAAAKEGNPGSAVYSASKAGLVGLVKSVAREVADQGILVNAVTPGSTDTPMLAQGPGIIDYVVSRTPMRRLARAEEVAAAVAWLLSPDCSFTTGSCLDVSGGRSAY